MRLKSFSTLLYSIGLLFISQGARSAQNRTVEETSREIIYSAGTWLNGTYGSTTTRFTITQGSFATFSFTGASALYFVGYGLIAENLNSGTIADVQFDGVVNRVNLHRDHGGSVVMWSSGPIDPTQTHTIVCMKTSQDNWHYDLHIDSFILTIPDPGDIISTSTTTTTSTGSETRTSTSLTETSSISSSLTTSLTTTTTSGTALVVPVPSNVWTPTDHSNATDSGISDAPTGPSSAASSTGPLTGAIVGGVIGAVILLCLASAFFFLLGRKHRREASVMFPYTSEKRAAPPGRISNDTELDNLTPTTFTPSRAVMGWRDTVISATTNSTSRETNTQGILPTGIPDGEDTSSSWLASPPTYNQVMSPNPSTPLPRTKG